jgi:hypothetical protein
MQQSEMDQIAELNPDVRNQWEQTATDQLETSSTSKLNLQAGVADLVLRITAALARRNFRWLRKFDAA